MVLKEIFIYPVKSLGGISVKQANVRERGLEYDRRFMIVDPNGKCITQREVPHMAGLQCELDHDKGILIRSRDQSSKSIVVNFPDAAGGERMNVQVWDSQLEAVRLGKEYDEFLSDVLGTPCKLVCMDEQSRRYADRNFTQNENQVSFADGYPYLIISQASLEELNSRLKQPLPIDRFRPNFVIDGVEAYAEDSIRKLAIGKIRFEIVKPCARCVVTTIDPDTFEKRAEPLATLSTYRKVGNEVHFGVNALAVDKGPLSLNDRVEILA